MKNLLAPVSLVSPEPVRLVASDSSRVPRAPEVDLSPMQAGERNGTNGTRQAWPPEVPEHLQASVVIVEPDVATEITPTGADGTATRALMLYVDQREKSSAAVRTWLQRLAETHITYEVKHVTVAELERLRRLHAPALRDLPAQAMQREARLLLSLAAAAGASDVHVLLRRHHTEVQCRIHGDLHTSDKFSLHAERGERLVRAIYNGLATNKPPEFMQHEFQHAQIDGETLAGTGLSTVRIARGPMVPADHGGGYLVARLQGQPGAVPAISRREAIRQLQLRKPTRPAQSAGDVAWKGFAPAQVRRMQRIALRPNGLVALTGPVGSGKTQAIYHLERYLAQRFPERRQVTIEDPPEFEMDWAVQLAVGERTFLDLLRETLRMDPNTLLVGELRAPAEAEAALEAALAGRLVLTTLHVIDPYYFFQRLEDMDPERMPKRTTCNAEKVVAVIGLRLLQRLCEHCRVPLVDAPAGAVPDEVSAALSSWGDTLNVHVRGAGCSHCDGLGTAGRQVVAEIIEMDAGLMGDLRENTVDEVKRRHRAQPESDYSMLAYAVAHILAGRVDPNDAQAQLNIESRGDERLPSLGEIAT